MLSNLGHYAFFSCVIHTAWSQGSADLTFSSNPVCNGENVTLTWTYASNLPFLQLTVEAYDGTLQKGYLFYMAGNLTGLGVFSDKKLNGWPSIPNTAKSYSMMLTATPSLELDYNCSFDVYDNVARKPVTLTCTPARLQVHVSPSPPTFIPNPIIFNDSDSGIIVCVSPGGKPAAAVSLTVSSTKELSARNTSDDSTSVILSRTAFPMSHWHNALATCRVTSHNCFNSSILATVPVNFIKDISVPEVIYANETVVLNCSTYISYYPGVRYNWTISSAANVTGSLYLEWISVPQGHIGSFYCTATNNVTMASVVVVFTVSNSSRPSTPANNGSLGNSGCEQCWIIGVVLGIIAIVTIVVVFGVLCKRGHFSKGKKKPDVQPSGTDQRSDHGNNRVRLIIASQGVVGQLSVRALHSTAIVEYSDRSCSLNGILEKVEQAVARSPTKFKSVALLLRPATVGVTLSEVDQAVLNSTSIKGEKLRTFIARLANICLDERGGTRMDILNYQNGKAPKRLSEALTELLGIPTTVSKDQFGIETPTDEKGGHAVVADTYFDRNNLGEIVYAELQLPSVRPQTQSRPSDDGVTYSEIRR